MTPFIPLIERIRDANNDLLTIFRSLSPDKQKECAEEFNKVIARGEDMVRRWSHEDMMKQLQSSEIF